MKKGSRAKKAVVKADKKKVVYKKAVKKAAAKKFPGFSENHEGIMVPSFSREEAEKVIVKPSKLLQGVQRAKKEIAPIVKVITSIPNVSSIEFALGFNMDGKFMGFGLGADTSVKITIAP